VSLEPNIPAVGDLEMEELPSLVVLGKCKAPEPDDTASTSSPEEDVDEEDELDPSSLVPPLTKRRRTLPGSPPVKADAPFIKNSEYLQTSRTGSGELVGVVLNPCAVPSGIVTTHVLSAKKMPKPKACVSVAKAKAPRKLCAKGKGSRSVPTGSPRPVPITISTIDKELVRVLEITEHLQPPIWVCYWCTIDPFTSGYSPTASGNCHACVVWHQPYSLKGDSDVAHRTDLISCSFHYVHSSPASTFSHYAFAFASS
jgi:hypothetical protein